MKTFFSDIIPRLQKYSQKLDNLTLLTNQHWVVIDDIENNKNVYIFRNNRELLISQNGKVEKAKWEYLGNNALLIDRKEESYLFKQGFFDQNILALKVDSKNEYAFLVNETKFEKELNNSLNVAEFLNNYYLSKEVKKKIQMQAGISSQSENDIFQHTAPEYKILRRPDKISLFGSVKEVYYIDFKDSFSGEIFVKTKNKQAFFKRKNIMHFYEDLDSGIDALHYYLCNGRLLKKGFIGSYS
jgi:hypothetical protein